MTIQDLINELEGLGSLITQYVTGTQAQYDALSEKDEGTIYFITDRKVIYKGSTCYSGVRSISSEVKNDTDNKENEYYKITISPAVGEDIILNIKTIGAIDEIKKNIYNDIQAAQDTVQDNLDNHIQTISDNEISAHVKLSDATNSESDVDGGIAATPKAVKEALRLAKEYAEETMAVQGSFEVLKGYITTNGIIESAEDTDINGVNINSLTGYEKGWAFFVKAAGHYVGEDCEINDKIICVNNYSESFKASDFIVLQANIDGAVTSTEQLTEDTLMLGNGGHSIKPLDNGADKQVMTMVDGKPQWSDNVDTDTTYTFEDGEDGSFNVKPKDGQTQKINIGKPANTGHADSADKVEQTETTETDIPFLLRDTDGKAQYNPNFTPKKFDEYLPKTGGTMEGDIDMGGNEFKNTNFELVESLPTENLYEGRQVTYEGKIYTYHNEKWISTADDLGDLKETLSSEFVFRPTADTYSVKDEFASVKSIKGNTVVWNQLIKHFEKSDAGITVLKNGSIFTVNGTSTVTWSHFQIVETALLKAHKLYLKYTNLGGSITANGTYPNLIDGYNSFGFSLEQSKSIIFTASSTNNFIIGAQGNIGDIYNNFQFYLKLIDLTQMFGEGDEPTSVEEFEKLYSHLPADYNKGSLLNLNADSIKSVGFNQWDEEWEVGMLGHNGNAMPENNAICSKNYIKVLPDTDYFFKADGYEGYYACFDENYKNINKDTSYLIQIIGLRHIPVNCHYIKFFIRGTSIYNKDICINLSHTGERNGEYEPYEEHIVNLPIKKYFPDGMKSAGTAYDEIVFDKNIGKYKAIQRIGSRAYTSGDESNVNVKTDNTTTYYELETPIETIIDDYDLIAYKANDWGTEEVLSEEPTTSIKADIEYNFDSNEIIKYNYFRIDDFRKNYLRKDETAASAEKLANPRKITLTGDATGETLFDGSGDVEINVEIEKDFINASIETIDTINYTDPNKTNIPNEYAIAEAVTGVIQLLTWKTLGDV